jgi:hypothetical protein
MEPPATTTTTINNCLKQSNLIDKSANNNEQLLYINEVSDCVFIVFISSLETCSLFC